MISLHNTPLTYPSPSVNSGPTSLSVWDYDYLPAALSYDMWSLGVILYNLCTNCNLFPCNGDGNIQYPTDLKVLASWTDQIKRSKLSVITDRYARNLASILLTKEPSKRPDIAHVLAHPFLTNKKAARLGGDAAEYDVFLSYRPDADLANVEALYDALTANHLLVWWDKKCMHPGEKWEEKFFEGLVKSSVFVPVISRAAIHDPQLDKNNFSKLISSSPCDNVFLGYRIALELTERGLLDKVFPVFFPDNDDKHATYSFGGVDNTSFYYPSESVDAVEEKVREHLERLGLGLPFKENMTVSEVMQELTSFSGALIDGSMDFQDALSPAIFGIVDAAKYDVFLSYRVDSEKINVEKLYNGLTNMGLKVYWDKKCLKPGEKWEDGFCTGLAKAKVFVPLLSKEGINNPDRSWQNFSKLTETSPCDNVFLEYRMALDLCHRGLVDKVFPVFFPDAITKKSYTFRAAPGAEASHPTCPAVVVKSVEEKLCEHLERLNLGLPLPDVPTTVEDVIKELLTFQGGFVEGLVEMEDALTPVIKSIVETVRNPKTSKRSTRKSFDGIPVIPAQSPTTLAAKQRQQPKPRIFSSALASASKLLSRENSASVIPTNTANSTNTATTVSFGDVHATIS